ncbi:hypothetical protein Hte_003785 [Hypoxylon texense]
MDNDQWKISLPYLQANEEDASFHIDDEDGQSHREMLTGWEKKNGSGVKGRTVEVVHGFLTGGKDIPVTLIVFEWLLVPGRATERLKDVTINIRFQAVGERENSPPCPIDFWDPVPINVAPYEPVLSQFSLVNIEGNRKWEVGATVGYAPFVTVQPMRGKGPVKIFERVDYRYITGRPQLDGRAYGEPNSVEWRFTENKTMEPGVQYLVKTAVLLKRKNNDFGKFVLVVQSSANRTDTFLKTPRLRKTDGPSTFDPTVKPSENPADRFHKDVARRPTIRPWKDLHTVSLDDILLTDMEVLDKARGNDSSSRSLGPGGEDEGSTIEKGGVAGTALNAAAETLNVQITGTILERLEGLQYDKPHAAIGRYGTPFQAAVVRMSKLEQSKRFEDILSLPATSAGNSLSAATTGGFYHTALHAAVFMSNTETVRRVLALDGSSKVVDVRDVMGRLPLHGAATHDWDLMKELSTNESTFRSKDFQGRNALHFAAASGAKSVVDHILSDNENRDLVDEPDIDGWTPLHWAYRAESEETIAVLISHNADKTIAAKNGWLPYHVAAFHGRSFAETLQPKKGPADEDLNQPSVERAICLAAEETCGCCQCVSGDMEDELFKQAVKIT